MALARTRKASGAAFGASATGPTTASFTPANSSLLVAFLELIDDGSGSFGTSLSITDTAGLTWTRRVNLPRAGGFKCQGSIWTAPVTTGASMTVTFGMSGVTANEWNWRVVEYTGHNAGAPVGGIGSLADDTTDGPFSFTLDASPATDSLVEGFMGVDGDLSGTVGVTPGATFTADNVDGSASVATYSELEFRTGSTSTTVDWVDVKTGTMTIFSVAGMGIEIKASGGGGGSRGLFRPSSASGVGIGGSFFRDPLQASMRMVRRDQVFVPAWLGESA